jgi:hypothetical protein
MTTIQELKEARSIAHFLSNIEINDDDKCWNWQGSINHAGYGIFYLLKNKIRAHRFSFELFKCFIPDGLTVDHLCFNKKCVNPRHLESVTLIENIRRGNGKIFQSHKVKNNSINHRKRDSITHCPQGHPYSSDNTYRIGNHRMCRACQRLRHRNSYRVKHPLAIWRIP